jgi:hypothetical protein
VFNDVNEKGVMVEKATGKPPAFICGNSFSTIDTKDPEVAEKIMENGVYFRYRIGYRQLYIR